MSEHVPLPTQENTRETEEMMPSELWQETLNNIKQRLDFNNPMINESAHEETVKACGERLVLLFDKFLHVLAIKPRDIAVFEQYIASDDVILADVASAYRLSRERIRQINLRILRYLCRRFHAALRRNDVTVIAYTEELCALFEVIDYDAASLFTYGMENVSHRKKEAILRLLFGLSTTQEELAKRVEAHRQATDALRAKENLERRTAEYLKQKAARAQADRQKEWLEFEEKFVFPSPKTTPYMPVHTVTPERKYAFERRFHQKLCRIAKNQAEIIESPDIIYYTTSATRHRPHYLLRLPNGREVLVLLLPTINMAYLYNIRRENALHDFCKQNGYGYLITDERGHSIGDLQNHPLDPALVKNLDDLLEQKGVIFWGDIKVLRQTVPVTNEDLATYVLTRRLALLQEPFRITHRISL